MFSYARRLLSGRPTLWWAALGCAALLVLPFAVLATVFVRPATMLLLTGDLRLAADVVPAAVAEREWLVPASAAAVVVLAVVFNRLYALLLWASDEARSSGWVDSWRGTRRTWRRVLVLNALFLALLLALAGVLGALTAVALSASPAAATVVLLAGLTSGVVLRTIGRIYITLAARAAILENQGVAAAWKAARAIVKDRRRQVVAAWASLLALGAAVWLGGRLVTPILQDTAFDFPALSSYALAREAAQVAVAIPLEAFVLVLSSAIWTAVYRGIETEIEPTASRPWLPRALALLVVLVVVGNGVPAIVDVAWRNHQTDRRRSIRAIEMIPRDARRALSVSPESNASRTTYSVVARLDGDRLEWSTTIEYTNGTGRPLRRIPLRVYPAAFTGEIEEMPLADEMLSSAIPNAIQTRLLPGTFEVEHVEGSGRPLESKLSGTVLWVELDEAVRDAEAVKFRVALAAELPQWPLRYGTWDGITQLGNWIPTIPLETEQGFRLDPYGGIGDPFVSRTADYDVRFEAPGTVGFVGTGTLVAVTSAGGRHTWRFVADDVRDAAFAAGTALRGLERRAGGTLVRVWYNGEDSVAGHDLVEEAASAIHFFAASYGSLTSEEVDVVRLENPLGGMEYPSLVYVSAGFSQLEGLPLLPDLVAHSGFVKEQERYIAGHELAHQWWYAEVGNDQIREPWLDEGFAEASTRLWLESVDGDERTSKIAHLERNPEAESGVIDKGVAAFATNSEYADAIYDAGGAVLLELHDLLGARRYDRLMAEWFTTQKGRVATIDEFMEVAERVGGPGARVLLERYRDR